MAMAEPFPREGLPLAEARERVLAAIAPLAASERLPLAACLGRVSAEACHASCQVAMPMPQTSSVGWAVSSA